MVISYKRYKNAGVRRRKFTALMRILSPMPRGMGNPPELPSALQIAPKILRGSKRYRMQKRLFAAISRSKRMFQRCDRHHKVRFAPNALVGALMNSFEDFVERYDELLNAARSIAPGSVAPPFRPRIAENERKVLVFSPHPDDESLTGALALRLRTEGTFHVIVVAVTLGSLVSRRAVRKAELENACRYLGFDLLYPRENGLESIEPAARREKTREWQDAVARITDILNQYAPRILIFPHENDGHSTHVGVHYLVLDALPASRVTDCFLVETEFWRPMESPNFLLASSPAEVAELVTAVSFHTGEIRRNPYHLALPAWMHDNARRGAERVLGQGAAAPPFNFATLYALKRWRSGVAQPLQLASPLAGPSDRLTPLFES